MIRGRQVAFLALTFLVMVAVIFLSKDLTSALLVISLLTNFLIISSQLTLISERHAMALTEQAEASNVSPDLTALLTATSEGFADETEGESLGEQSASGLRQVGAPGLDSEFVRATVAGLEAAAAGDLNAGELGGNLYAGCAPDPALSRWDGAPRSSFDADRQLTEQARWRNGLDQRVAAGRLRRKDLIDRYMGEELDAEEHKPWWGRYEA